MTCFESRAVLTFDFVTLLLIDYILQMASSNTSASHGFSAMQLSGMQDAILALDQHLVRCVKAIRKKEWTVESMKDEADRQVREHVVCFFPFFFYILTNQLCITTI